MCVSSAYRPLFSVENSIINIFHFRNFSIHMHDKKKLNPINFPHESNIYRLNFVMCHMMVLFAQIQHNTCVCICIRIVSYRIVNEFASIETEFIEFRMFILCVVTHRFQTTFFLFAFELN